MGLFKILLLLGSTAAIVLTYRTNSKLTNIITAGMLVSLVLVQFNDILFTGIYTYMVFVFLAFVYGLFYRGLTIRARMIVCLMSASMLAYWLWITSHWNGNTGLIPPLALVVGISAFYFRKEVKTEWGFLLILFVDALDSVIEILF